METLAIIAYQQPVTRGDIESIRGVAVSTYVHQDARGPAVDRGRRASRNAWPSRTVATTKQFLDDLNLRSLSSSRPLTELDPSPPELPDAPAKAAGPHSRCEPDSRHTGNASDELSASSAGSGGRRAGSKQTFH
jgi:segregation and condensation protein B